eukprot:32731-Prymnesium_polylepis.2
MARAQAAGPRQGQGVRHPAVFQGLHPAAPEARLPAPHHHPAGPRALHHWGQLLDADHAPLLPEQQDGGQGCVRARCRWPVRD